MWRDAVRDRHRRLRIAFGGHFASDVVAAGLVSFCVIWLAHGWLYRWPSTRVSDAVVEPDWHVGPGLGAV